MRSGESSLVFISVSCRWACTIRHVLNTLGRWAGEHDEGDQTAAGDRAQERMVPVRSPPFAGRRREVPEICVTNRSATRSGGVH